MSQFIYETHLHTAKISACCVTEPENYISAYKKAGYAGIFVTDHFFNGNSGINKKLPWEQKVHKYCEGYKRAKKIGDKKDFDVFFGLEYNFDGDEYLIYGLDENWLVSHPEIMNFSHAELFKTVDSLGGLMIQAHPFRKRDYIKQINLHPECVHGVEVYNSGNKREENAKAFLMAKDFHLPMTSGSDMHDVKNIHKFIADKSFSPGGVIFPERLKSIEDFISGIKGNRHTILM